ncbi:cytochrome P450 [Aspergillus melleus]|uniref:cytochrome P450 n=1 Tax=Aspergillus melleus TaxID=138277 RepID=UPI001E8D6B55|nr:uncharacterized protein LDX57_005044 [Aspergillus melleus]KAH8427330.1 hypothetical protein LDX57_005044 [Aspergillus melleus]
MATFAGLELPSGLAATGCILGLLLAGTFFFMVAPQPEDPKIVNKYRWDYFEAKARREFDMRAEELINNGVARATSTFHMITGFGLRLILSDKLADAAGMDDRLDQDKGIASVNLVHLKGLETKFAGELHDSVPRPAASATSKRLVHLTRPFSDETEDYLQKVWTDSTEWHELLLYPMVGRMTAQITGRAFVGPNLCRDPRWLEIIATYSVKRYAAVVAVQQFATFLHPFVHRILPACRKLRDQVRQARELIQPELDRIKHKKVVDEEFTSLAWIHEFAQGSIYDAGLAQLRLAAVANHTTTDMMCKIMIRLCQHPELIQPLREEAIWAVRDGGLRIAALQKMFLMESFMQESQRLEPFMLLSMFRYATETVDLPDGTIIPQGTLMAVANPSRLDPTIFPDPEKFDAYRFVKLRQDPERAHLAPFTKTSYSQLNFGHGKQACPGRFIAVNEIKIVLCHILLKYDMELVEEAPSELVRVGLLTVCNPGTKIRVRRREEEVAL